MCRIGRPELFYRKDAILDKIYRDVSGFGIASLHNSTTKVPNIFGIKIEILGIALENSKIFSTKTFHRNTYSGLILRICLHCFVQDYLLRKFVNIQEKNLRRSLFLNKVANLQPYTVLKKDCDTVVFLRLFHRHKHLFHRTTPGDCF